MRTAFTSPPIARGQRSPDSSSGALLQWLRKIRLSWRAGRHPSLIFSTLRQRSSKMNHDWQMELETRGRPPAMVLPPALVEESAWDILLALHSDEGCKLSLDMLGSVVSAPQPALKQW